MSKTKTLDIAFIHPDLGVGGAERLVIDAAVAMKERGHRVVIFTSHHDPLHCFPETKGELKVVVLGDWLPRQFVGQFYLLFATLRALYLAMFLFLFSPFNFDVIVADQISYSIPILKKCADKVVFYCHFPDKLLAPKSTRLITRLYRYPFDHFEQYTILQADQILVNSQFTSLKFMEAFPKTSLMPLVLYPGIRMEAFSTPNNETDAHFMQSSKITLLSLNRFERKKDIALAIRSFCWLRENIDASVFQELRLVVAGGYDRRIRENREHLKELEELCREEALDYLTIMPDSKEVILPNSTQLLFLPSVSDARRKTLLCNALCLIYTPSFEHFGIVPLEAMACGIPVIAMNSGGPRETIVDARTGFLCDPTAKSVGTALCNLIAGKVDLPAMATASKEHVSRKFPLERFARELDEILGEPVPRMNGIH